MPIIRYIYLALFFCFFTTHSYASCIPYGIFTVTSTITPVQQSISLGRIVVKPSDQIGQVLKEYTSQIYQKESYLICGFSIDSYLAQGELSQRRPLSSLGNNIYSTNLGGIGVRISIQEGDTQKDFPFSTLINTYVQYFSLLDLGYRYSLDKTYSLKVQIIKTDNSTESGTLNSGRYAIYYTDNNKSKPLLTVDLNSTTIASSSCLITNNNTTVKLNDVTRSSFRGIGSVQGEQNFQVNVLCNGGDNLTSYTEQNQIGVNFNYTPSDYNSQAIKNTSTNSPASGVDLQLLWNDKNEVVLNNYNYVLGSVVSNDTQTYEIPLKARYIQTKEQVTPGQVQGLATITINYE